MCTPSGTNISTQKEKLLPFSFCGFSHPETQIESEDHTHTHITLTTRHTVSCQCQDMLSLIVLLALV